MNSKFRIPLLQLEVSTSKSLIQFNGLPTLLFVGFRRLRTLGDFMVSKELRGIYIGPRGSKGFKNSIPVILDKGDRLEVTFQKNGILREIMQFPLQFMVRSSSYPQPPPPSTHHTHPTHPMPAKMQTDRYILTIGLPYLGEARLRKS